MPILFPGPFFPQKKDNRMSNVGNASWVREDFLKHRQNNLEHLLRHRYQWMNKFIQDGEKGLEIGAGAGFSSLYLRNDATLWLSDCALEPWLNSVIDGLNLPFKNDTLDFIIAVDVIHHLAHPLHFFKEAQRVLKPGGRLIIKDVHASTLMRATLKLMQHEGYSYHVDPFSMTSPCNDPTDPWSGNNAVTDLLWRRRDELETSLQLTTVYHRLSESIMLYISGGVTARNWTLHLPFFILRTLQKIDDFLSITLPLLFPSARHWVLKKTIS